MILLINFDLCVQFVVVLLFQNPNTMKACFCFVLLIAVTSAFEYTAEWEMWKRQHGRDYASETESIYRQTIWEANKKYVDNHNANADLWGFTLTTNEYADLESSEFTRIYNGLLPTARRSNTTRVHQPSNLELPDKVDWRDQGVVTKVKNQGQCGSCWAFSTTGSLEGQHALKTGKLVSLSEQQLVDCSGKYGNQGCNGGLMDQAFQYIKANGGDDTESSYPYRGEDGTCEYNPANVGATLTGYTDVKSKSTDDLKNAVGTVGPISVAMDASHMSFQLYHSGVYSPWFCSETKLDHGVLAVGYGNTDGKDYWLVKNSWGDSWGMDGYFMIEVKGNKCGIATQASYPTV